MILYIALFELCMLAPAIIYRFFRIVNFENNEKRIVIREKSKDVTVIVLYSLLCLLIYRILKYQLVSFDYCCIIILIALTVILEYLRILNDLI